jgi:hypothetical protein
VILRLWIGWLLLLTLAASPVSAAVLCLDSDPSDLDAWANDRYLGRTPLTSEVAPGEWALRLAEPAGDFFRMPAIDTLITVTREDSLRIHLSLGTEVSIYSEPSGLPLIAGGRSVGTTPLTLRIDPGEATSLSLRSPRGEISVPMDTLLAARQWVWKGPTLGIPVLGQSDRSRWRTVGRYVMPLLAIGFGVGGLLVEDAADRSYDRYLHTVDPERLERFYDQAHTRDAWAAACWISAEVSLVSAVVAWVFPERHEAPGASP